MIFELRKGGVTVGSAGAGAVERLLAALGVGPFDPGKFGVGNFKPLVAAGDCFVIERVA